MSESVVALGEGRYFVRLLFVCGRYVARLEFGVRATLVELSPVCGGSVVYDCAKRVVVWCPATRGKASVMLLLLVRLLRFVRSWIGECDCVQVISRVGVGSS